MLFLKYRCQILVGIFALIICGCNKDTFGNGSFSSYPSIYPEYLRVYWGTFNNNQIECKIYSTGAWSISPLPDWLHASEMSGTTNKSVLFTCDENTTNGKRTAYFYVEAKNHDWSRKQRCYIYQNWVAVLSVDATYKNQLNCVIPKGGTFTIPVNTNLDDIQVVAKSGSSVSSWVTTSYDATKNELKLVVAPNYSGLDRSADVTISSKSVSIIDKFSIKQLFGINTFTDLSDVLFDADGGSEKRGISASVDWTAKASDQTWFSISPTAGEANLKDTLTITALPNYGYSKRDGGIHLFKGNTTSGYTSLILVKQGARFIRLTTDKVNLDVDGGSQTLSVESNVDWEIKSKPDWLNVDITNGRYNGVITLSAAPNQSLLARSGVIRVCDVNVKYEYSFAIVEQAPVTITTNALRFPWYESLQKVPIEFPQEWSAVTSGGWISMSSYSGNGPTEILVSTTRNDEENARTGSITFLSEGKSYTVEVAQDGQYITIDDTSGEVSPAGGNIELFVSSTVDFTRQIDYDPNDTQTSNDWVTVTNDDKGNNTISVAANPSTHPRSATLRLVPVNPDSKYGSDGVMFRIKQKGRDLMADVSKVLLLPEGGTTTQYAYAADGEVLFTMPTLPWISVVVDKVTKSFYFVCGENNEGEIRNAELTIKLLDLPNGEEKSIVIPITQYPYGKTIIVGDDYGPDIEF